jgi:hypothetical protein
MKEGKKEGERRKKEGETGEGKEGRKGAITILLVKGNNSSIWGYGKIYS